MTQRYCYLAAVGTSAYKAYLSAFSHLRGRRPFTNTKYKLNISTTRSPDRQPRRMKNYWEERLIHLLCFRVHKHEPVQNRNDDSPPS